MSKDNKNDRPTSQDVHNLGTKIMVNFGVMNCAALAATFANINEFSNIPAHAFAIGLIASIFSQIIWYAKMEIDHMTEEESVFASVMANLVFTLLSGICMLGGGALSSACLVYGCFLLFGFSHSSALYGAFLLCILPVIMMFYIALRSGYEDGMAEARRQLTEKSATQDETKERALP